jgi:hypothetical protein
VAAKPKPASLSVTRSSALAEAVDQYSDCRWELANILKYLISLSVELRESHVLGISLGRGSWECAEVGLASTMWRDASLSVSTASARMCRGDMSELPESPLERRDSTR